MHIIFVLQMKVEPQKNNEEKTSTPTSGILHEFEHVGMPCSRVPLMQGGV